MKKKTISKTVLLASASFAGFNIGSGFATGIEAQQFFASWGVKYAVIGIIIAMVASIFVLVPVYLTGFEQNFDDEKKIYYYFCGSKLGLVFDGYIYFNILLTIITMMSGAGATINQYFGVPEFIGAIILGALCIVAALLGLKRLMKILSYIGVLIILFVILCAIYIFFKSDASFFMKSSEIESFASSGKLLHANIFGLESPYLSAIASAGVLITSGAPWACVTGTICKTREEAVLSGTLSGIFYYLAQSIVVYLNLVAMRYIIGAEVPLLAVIQHFLPMLSLIYSCIIILAIFSTVSGRLFVFASRFDKGNKKTHFIITAGIVLISCIAGSFISFSKISNLIFSISGMAGTILSVIIIIRFILIKKSHNNIDDLAEDPN